MPWRGREDKAPREVNKTLVIMSMERGWCRGQVAYKSHEVEMPKRQINNPLLLQPLEERHSNQHVRLLHSGMSMHKRQTWIDTFQDDTHAGHDKRVDFLVAPTHIFGKGFTDIDWLDEVEEQASSLLLQ